MIHSAAVIKISTDKTESLSSSIICFVYRSNKADIVAVRSQSCKRLFFSCINWRLLLRTAIQHMKNGDKK